MSPTPAVVKRSTSRTWRIVVLSAGIRSPGATAVVRFKVHKGLASTRKFTAPVFSRTSYFTDPRYAAPERFLGVMGMPINLEGEIEAENLTLACRNAVLNMMELLEEPRL